MLSYSNYQTVVRVHGIFATSKNTTAVFLAIWFNNCEFEYCQLSPQIKIDKNTPTILHFLAKTQKTLFLLVVKMAALRCSLASVVKIYLILNFG